MAIAVSAGELDILSDARELEASRALRPIDVIDRREPSPPWVDEPGGQDLCILLGQTVQHGGAERGLLIVRRADEARVHAEATRQPDKIVVRRLDALPGPSDLPATVLAYVQRTRQAVVLRDASLGNAFSSDPYLIEQGVRSLLCLPLVTQSRLIGALYLETHTAAQTFTPPRVRLLELMASQAAVSL